MPCTFDPPTKAVRFQPEVLKEMSAYSWSESRTLRVIHPQNAFFLCYRTDRLGLLSRFLGWTVLGRNM